MNIVKDMITTPSDRVKVEMNIKSMTGVVLSYHFRFQILN